MDETREELIERYRGARLALSDAVDGHPDVRVGEWGGREVLMHVVGWDRYGTEWVPRLVAGVPEEACDEDAMNAASVRLYASLDDASLRSEYTAAGEAFVAMLEALPDEAFRADSAGADWARGLADHALEHALPFGDIGS